MKCLQLLLLALLMPTAFVHGATPQWIQQLGSSASDFGYDVTADSAGNVYMTGFSAISLIDGADNFQDAFLAKYDASGGLQWVRELGASDAVDRSTGVAVDLTGNVVIAGRTFGDLAGPNAYPGGSISDGFLAKYNVAGDLLWARQFGSIESDYAEDIVVDASGSIYVAGYTTGDLNVPEVPTDREPDGFIAKYDSSGAHLWTTQFGTPESDYVRRMAIDALGGVYIVGYTDGSMDGLSAGGSDAFFTKFNSDGIIQWSRQLGTAEQELGYGISLDGARHVYLTGSTVGALAGPNAGVADAFIAKYDVEGNALWTRQFGSSERERGRDIYADPNGNVYAVGTTFGNLGGPVDGQQDVYLVNYDADGNFQWVEQFGSSEVDDSQRLAADGLGNLLITGRTTGNLGAQNVGGNDAFVAKFKLNDTVPEPAGGLMLLIGLAALTLKERFRSKSIFVVSAPIMFALLAAVCMRHKSYCSKHRLK